jgi:hypothetical protein
MLPPKNSLLRHLGRGRLLTWLRVGRHAHVLGRFHRHLKRPPQRPNHVSRGVAYLAALARDRKRLRLQTHDWGRMQKCLHSGRRDLYHEHHILTSYLFLPWQCTSIPFSSPLLGCAHSCLSLCGCSLLFIYLLFIHLPLGRGAAGWLYCGLASLLTSGCHLLLLSCYQ